MTIIIIIVIAIIFGFGIKFVIDAKNRRDAAEKAAKERAEKRIAKEKLRNNKILQMAVDCIVEHLQKNIKKAQNVTLDNKTEDFFVAEICMDRMCCYEGLMKKSPYSVDYKNQRDYYCNWFDGSLNCVLRTCYYDEGYSYLDYNGLQFFHEVLLEELKKHDCRTCHVQHYYERNIHDNIEYRYYLIWDLTPYHPKKELKSFF